VRPFLFPVNRYVVRIFFKEWLDSTPDGAGEIWDSKSNADRDYGEKGVRSKNFGMSQKPVGADFDPGELYLGKKQKKAKWRDKYPTTAI